MFCLKDHTPTRFSRILKSKILENREREYSGWFKTWLLGHQHFFNRCWHERYRDVSTDIATSMTSLWQDFQEFRISRFLKFWMSHPSVSQSITQWPGFSRILKSEILENLPSSLSWFSRISKSKILENHISKHPWWTIWHSPYLCFVYSIWTWSSILCFYWQWNTKQTFHVL